MNPEGMLALFEQANFHVEAAVIKRSSLCHYILVELCWIVYLVSTANGVGYVRAAYWIKAGERGEVELLYLCFI